MKKRIKLFGLMYAVLLFATETVHADKFTTSYIDCGGMAFPAPLQPIITTAVTLLEIIIPLGIVTIGSLDFLKAVAASDTDKMKKSQKKFISRLIAGAIALFVFVGVKLAVDFFADDSANKKGDKKDYGVCLNCLINGEDCGEATESPFFKDVKEDK